MGVSKISGICQGDKMEIKQTIKGTKFITKKVMEVKLTTGEKMKEKSY